jgi:Trk K+ transport system NAD-binding subunit
MINRGGALVPIRGQTVLQAGDEVLLLTDPDNDAVPAALFTQPRH